VEGLPVDHVEDRDIRAVMMPAKINFVGRKMAQATALGEDMMGNRDGPDLLKATNTGRKEWDAGKGFIVSSNEVGGDSVTSNIKLYRPREILERNFLVLVAEDVMKGDRRGETVQSSEGLQFNDHRSGVNREGTDRIHGTFPDLG
jgi:hypothetical protein